MSSARSVETRESTGLVMTRLAPPIKPARLLERPRIYELLGEAINYPLTVLVAPAGSGKTTALAALAYSGRWPVAWCRMSPADNAAQLVLHLAAAFRPVAALDEGLIRREIQRSPHDAIEALVNELAATLSETTLLIIDDYHLVDLRPALRDLLAEFVAIQPMRLRMLLASRYEPDLPSLPVARARSELATITQQDLAFTSEETRAFFTQAGADITPAVEDLHALARGWPLALQLAAGEAPGGAPGSSMAPLAAYPQALLDEYLLAQVLEEQPAALQQFLLRSAALRWLDQEACRVLPGLDQVEHLLDQTRHRMLFLEQDAAGRPMYQPLFHAFLDRQARTHLTDWNDLHHRAAEYYGSQQDADSVIYHLLQGNCADEAANELARISPEYLAAGRIDELLNWIERLPSEQAHRADILEVTANADRRLGRFSEAIEAFQQAEIAHRTAGNRDGQVRSLRGRAEIYLDTVQPAPATALLKRALKLLPAERRSERASLLRLQAENWTNSGRADVAILLEASAHQLEQAAARASRHRRDHEHDMPAPPRLLLRSGRLHSARQQLEAALDIGSGRWQSETHDQPLAASEESTASPIAAHRDPLLLLALIHALLGNGARAVAMARRGLLEAQAGDSLLTQGIAFMRLGHAYQLIASLDAGPAEASYAAALELVQPTGIVRTRAEVSMGLTLLRGHSGDLAGAEVAAAEGLHIAEAAGDEWMVALIWTALGGAAVTLGHDQALDWLNQARQRFLRGGDTYGEALVALWCALWYMRHNDDETTMGHVDRLLTMVKQYGYEGLVTTPTLFGPRDMAMLVPLLLIGRRLPTHSAPAQQLLRQAFPSIAADDTVVDYHPGYTLRVQMMGGFRVWRGWHEIQAREWQREKARQLFQLLLTYRGHWLQREQICAWLWPESDLEAAERQFKVTLNALNAALEPQRPPRTAPFFIRRQGLAYSFAPSFGVWIDVDELELRVAGANTRDDPEFALRNSQMAVQLYKGDYLTEALYDPWTLEERERLLARYLATATIYAGRLLERGDLQGAVQLCEQVLRRDRGYEEAYQVLMRAHARSGSRSQAIRSYNRCVRTLQEDLGIEPLPETTALYEQIKRNEQI
jgi:LuxR family transcriptional regulator, maltose regulon positive regulatory protein